jgi:hypothetical protein
MVKVFVFGDRVSVDEGAMEEYLKRRKLPWEIATVGGIGYVLGEQKVLQLSDDRVECQVIRQDSKCAWSCRGLVAVAGRQSEPPAVTALP